MENKELLEKWIKANNTPQQVALRCRIVQLSSQNFTDSHIAEKLSVTRKTCRLWRTRFIEYGPKSLWEVAEGRGRKPDRERARKIVEATLHTRPEGMTHWSTRTLASALGESQSTVCRIWSQNNLQPYRQDTFKLSRDPKFIEKLTDVVGVYMNPPNHAVVLCVDEKSQIQALDRTQPGLPLKKGRCGTMTHDYKRNGTTCLFAALNVLEGKILGQCHARHRHQEFLKFLRKLDREHPKHLELHLVLDNYGTHKKDKVLDWLEKHPRFKLHFIPTSSSWLNLVERWFRELTDKALRRGVFTNVIELEDAIQEFIGTWNEKPTPFVWTASVDKILSKLERARKTLEDVSPGCTQKAPRKSKSIK